MNKVEFVVVIDGKPPGPFGVYFPDCPGCTSMGNAIEEVLANAAEALADWAEDVDPMPQPRSIEAIRKDPELAQDLAEGATLATVELRR